LKFDFLNPFFIYGSISGIILICFFLIWFNGFYFALDNGKQIYSFHVIWLCLIFLFAHYRLKGISLDKVKGAFAFTLLVYFIHDSFWALKFTAFPLPEWFPSMDPNPGINLLAFYSRSLTIIASALFYLRDRIKLTWKTFLFISFQIIYWLYPRDLIPLPLIEVDFLEMSLDLLPYLFTI